MDECGWVILLMALGAGAEVVGLVLIARDIRSDRLRARKLLRRDVTIFAGAALTHDRALRLDVTGGQPPTLEDRIAALERRVDEIEGEIDKAGRRVSSELRGEIERVQRQLQTNLGGAIEQVRDTFLEVLQGDTKQRLVGVVVLATGIAVSLAGNIWSLYVTC